MGLAIDFQVVSAHFIDNGNVRPLQMGVDSRQFDRRFAVNIKHIHREKRGKQASLKRLRDCPGNFFDGERLHALTAQTFPFLQLPANKLIRKVFCSILHRRYAYC